MTKNTLETAIIRPSELEIPPNLALQMYRQSKPAVRVAGLCYATPEYARILREGDLPYKSGFHFTLVEAIDVAAKSAHAHRYDFIAMAGPQETQLQDVLAVARAQFSSRRNSPLYVLGEIRPKTAGLLKILGPAYGLPHIPVVRDISKIKEIGVL